MDQIRKLLAQQEAERLAEGTKAGNKAEDHQPAEYATPTGWVKGCTCGQHAAHRAARMSMRHVWFAQHVKKLGLPLYDPRGKVYGEAVYQTGAAKGLTWTQAYARGIDINK